MKENVRSISEKFEEKTENTRLNSVNSRNTHFTTRVNLKQKIK